MSNKLDLAVERLKTTIGAQDTRQAALLVDSIGQCLDELTDVEKGEYW